MAQAVSVLVQDTATGFAVTVFNYEDTCIANFYVQYQKGQWVMDLDGEIYTYSSSRNVMEAIEGFAAQIMMNEVRNEMKRKCSGWTGEVWTRT